MTRYLALVAPLLALAWPLLGQFVPPMINSPKSPPPAERPTVQTAKPSAVAAPKTGPLPKDLKYPALRPIPVPKIDIFTMANGMTVYLLEDHELPLVTGTALVRTGNLFDPYDKAGLATLTGVVMRTGGTKARSVDQLDEQLENVAASVESAIGETSGTVTFSALKENTAAVLEVFRDVLTSPEFRQENIDQAKSAMRNMVARRNEDARTLAAREFVETVYGKETPYGWRPEHATLNRISRGDLQAFHRRYFFPANITLAVRGDFVASEMKSRLEALFSGWTEKQEVVPEFPKVTPRPSGGLYLAEKKDAAQTYFWIGHVGSTLDDKDYPALQLATAILGGGPQSRLNERVRRTGANEIAATWAAEFDHPGLLRIGGSTKPGMTIETIRAVLDEVDRLRGGDVSDDELRTAKEAAVNSLVFASDTRSKTLTRAMHYAHYGYPADFAEQLRKGLAAVTKADVQRVMRDRLNPERFAIVVVGNPLEFGQGLEAVGKPVTGIDLTIAQPKLEVTKADDSSVEKGKQLLAKAQEAVGGAEKLAAVKDSVQIAGFKVDPAAGGMQLTETDQWIAPSYFRQESNLPKQGRIVAFFDGKSGVIAAQGGSGPLTGAQLRQVKGDLFRMYIPLLLSDRIPGRSVSAIDDYTIEISDASGEVAKLVLDPTNWMPSRILYDMLPSAGSQISIQDILSDFREVAGVKVPFAFTIMQSGQKFADVTVTDFQVNKGLKVEDLKKLR